MAGLPLNAGNEMINRTVPDFLNFRVYKKTKVYSLHFISKIRLTQRVMRSDGMLEEGHTVFGQIEWRKTFCNLREFYMHL